MPDIELQIILADDDDDDRSFFKEALLQATPDVQLITVEDGEELMGYLEEKENPPPPHIIFLDINMPYKNGKQCLREIRNNRNFDEVPVIMISTSNYATEIEETYKSGANLFLQKHRFFDDDIKNAFSIYPETGLCMTGR